MRADLCLSLLLLALFGSAAASALTSLPWQAAAAPLLAAVPGSVLALLQVEREWRGRTGPAALGRPISRSDLMMAGWFLLAVATVTLLGFRIGGFLFVLAYLRTFSRLTLLGAVTAAAAVPAAATLAFEILLGTRSFPGVLLGGA